MTLWYDKRYHSLNYELRERFNSKIIKLSLDGNFTCPNRDGTLAINGCVFCSEKGSGDFTSKSSSISTQIEEQIELLKKKWPKAKYIAYFQNFSGTYAPVDTLRRIYEEALAHKDVVGIAIATRPDCLDIDVLNLLDEINQRTYLWIELGLQTIHEKTAIKINRHFSLNVFSQTLEKLNQLNIQVVIHLIFGLFNETHDEMMASVKYLATKEIFGIKIHLLHVMKDTQLEKIYANEKFHLLSRHEYIALIVEALEILPSNVVVHRLTGDSPWKTLIGPKWSTDKRGILNEIDKTLKIKNTYQGIKSGEAL